MSELKKEKWVDSMMTSWVPPQDRRYSYTSTARIEEKLNFFMLNRDTVFPVHSYTPVLEKSGLVLARCRKVYRKLRPILLKEMW